MCRLYAFRSSLRSAVHRSLIAAENALARQSAAHPDGWGLGYYVDDYPHLYRSPAQAMADGLFRELSSVVAAYTLLGHVRKASVGEINLLNCHPFQFGNWLFAHNGEIAGYNESPDIRRRVLDLVAPRFGRHLMGSTDSEVVFYAFLSRLVHQFEDIHLPGLPFEAIATALRATVDDVVAISDTFQQADGTEQLTKLTLIATNGNAMVGHRFRMPLYRSTYKTVCPERDDCPWYRPTMCEAPVDDGIVRHLVLASEKVAENPNVWIPLAEGETVGVDHGMHFRRMPGVG
ncbi:MAG: class II glutamine amidotransferase [Myxococcales bacterium]|nr:class II glutamine amidotransferase [Myxococcales bacterium]